MERHSHPSVAGFSPRRQKKSFTYSAPVLGSLVALFLIGLFLLYRSNSVQAPEFPAAPVAPAAADTGRVESGSSFFPTTADLGAHPMFAPLVGSAADTLPKVFVPVEKE